MLALPQGAADTATGRRPLVGMTAMAGQKGRQVRGHADGAHAGPPPPCGMQKVLCRLRWQTSAPMLAGLAQADLGVHVGAVHVDLAAVRRG